MGKEKPIIIDGNMGFIKILNNEEYKKYTTDY